MITIQGTWYDGRTSGATKAVCLVYGTGEIRIEASNGGEPLAARSRFDLDVSPRLADTPRHLRFPGGGTFETQDNDVVDQILSRFRPSPWTSLVHRLESRFPYILIALVLLAAFLWGALTYGVPALSKGIAFRLPPAAYQMASRQTLAAMDRSLLRPSELDAEVRERVLSHFEPALQQHPDMDLAIRFRKGGRLGPNAFALPDGTILFTDEMVLTAEDDDELTAVLAHEIGHVVHRHGMRRLVQDSLLGFGLLAITGDVAGSSEIFLGLPVILTELAYSREFEREADGYALAYLRSHDISPVHFARLMRRIQDRSKSRGKNREGTWTTYLSTHPALEERLRRFSDPSDLNKKGENAPWS